MEKKNYLKFIGNNIRLARLNMGLTQETLAEKCDVSTNYISSLERGISSGSIPLIINICDILNITPNFLFNHSINMKKKLNDNIDMMDSEILLYYLKLDDKNKDFINKAIIHLYDIQKNNYKK